MKRCGSAGGEVAAQLALGLAPGTVSTMTMYVASFRPATVTEPEYGAVTFIDPT